MEIQRKLAAHDPERPQIDKPEGDIPFDLGIDDIVVGDGDEATAGKTVSVHYAGVAFSTGEEFDASWNRDQPFELQARQGPGHPRLARRRAGHEGRRPAQADDPVGDGLRRPGAGGVIAPHEPLVFVVDLLAVD